MEREYKGRKGVQPIHLFNKVWRVGRINNLKGSRRTHVVIYGPNNEEYDVYDDEAYSFGVTHYDWDDEPYSHPERIDPAKVKIYILTSILDDKEKWSYDLSKPLDKGTPIQVIYDNGTIKNINFDGDWLPITIVQKYFMNKGVSTNKDGKEYTSEKKITPVCWRLK